MIIYENVQDISLRIFLVNINFVKKSKVTKVKRKIILKKFCEYAPPNSGTGNAIVKVSSKKVKFSAGLLFPQTQHYLFFAKHILDEALTLLS